VTEINIALTEVAGTITLHDAYCPQARVLAALGFPVVSMFDCERMPAGYPLHSCLGRPPQEPEQEAAPVR